MLLLAVVLPKDGIASGVDGTDCHAAFVAMVQVERVGEESLWEKPDVYIFPLYAIRRRRFERGLAVVANPTLILDILLPGLPSLGPGGFLVVDG